MYNKKLIALALALVMSAIGPMPILAQTSVDETIEENGYITPLNGVTDEGTISVSSDVPEIVSDFEYNLSGEQLEAKRNLSTVVEELAICQVGVDYVDGHTIFEAASEQEAEIIANGYDAELLSFECGIGIMKLSNGDTVLEAVSEGAQINNNLPAVYPDYLCEVDEEYNTSLYDGKMYLTALDTECPEQYHHSKINTEAGWNISKGQGVKIAIIDTGISQGHPNLEPNIAEAKFFGKQQFAEDTNGHGSHVAGLAAAVKANGISGVAPEAQIYALSVADNSGATFAMSNAIRATNYAIMKKVDVVNMSFSAPESVPIFEDSIEKAIQAGIVIVAAAGNDRVDLTKYSYYPACYKDVITVAATDSANNLADFSNYGEGKVDIAAPGVNIFSSDKEERYRNLSGTSMAAPIVTGVVAQAIGCGVGAGLEGRQKVMAIRNQLCQTTTSIGLAKYYGAGLVNAAGATKTIGIATKNGKTGLLAGEQLQCVGNVTGVSWTSSNPLVASIDSNGLIRAANNVSANSLVQITATKGEQSGSVLVGVYHERIKRVYLGDGTKAVKTVPMITEDVVATTQDDTVKMLDIWNNISKNEIVEYQCTTSNEEIATAEVSGNKLIVHSGDQKGSAFIYVVAQDGSKKSASVKINVTNPVTNIQIKNTICSTLNLSSYPIAIGKSVRLLGNANATATNKKIVWSCDGNPNVYITKSGTVKCKKTAVAGSAVTVKATAADGYQASKTITFIVTEPTQSITFVSNGKSNISLELAGNSSYLYKDYFTWKMNPVAAYGNGDTEYASISSSNKNIAYISGTKLNCLNKGTAYITIRALDGSGKKAVVKVRVK